MFFAGELWRLPVYAEDLGARNVGGAGVSLMATVIGVIAFGVCAVGLLKRKRWAAVGTALALGFAGFEIVANADSATHPAAAVFGAVIAFAGVAGALPLLRRPATFRA
jgi:hypothetical protein